MHKMLHAWGLNVLMNIVNTSPTVGRLLCYKVQTGRPMLIFILKYKLEYDVIPLYHFFENINFASNKGKFCSEKEIWWLQLFFKLVSDSWYFSCSYLHAVLGVWEEFLNVRICDTYLVFGFVVETKKCVFFKYEVCFIYRCRRQ